MGDSYRLGLLKQWSHGTLKTALIIRWRGDRCSTIPIFEHLRFVAHHD